MNLLRKFRQNISLKVLISILALSLTVTLIATVVRSGEMYKDHINNITTQMEYIKESYLPSLNESLWEMDKEQIQVQLQGILKLPNIQYVAILTEDMKIIASAGSLQLENRMTRKFQMSYVYNGQRINLGTLEVVAGLQAIKTLIWKDIYFTLITEGIKFFFLSVLILFIFHILVTRHLLSIANYTRHLNVHEQYKPFVLHRRVSKMQNQDELDEVVSALNNTMEALRESYDKLRQSNENLEKEIFERKQAEEALRSSENKLRDITSHLAEGIYVFNEQGHITFMNAEAERLFGWTMDELNEKGPHNLVHYLKPDGTPLPFEECKMYNVIKTGKRYLSTDEVFVRKDGTVFPIFVITAPIIEEGKVVASVTAFRDITERKQIEAEREKLILELKEALANIKTLSGLLPICASCKKVRDDKGYWNQIEVYISKHSEAEFSHGMCPDCAKKAYEELDKLKKRENEK
jgi:PAS domain S-box-containing protein